MREYPSADDWICETCGVALVSVTVRVRYVGTTLSVGMPRCPRCGMVMVTEKTATGKIAEAERVLEDK